MDDGAWPSILASIRQGDQAAVQRMLAWLHQGKGNQILSNRLRKRGVSEQSLKDAVADVQTTVQAKVVAGQFRGASYGELTLYIHRICQNVAAVYRKWDREINTQDPTEADFEAPLEILNDNTKDLSITANLRIDLEAALARVPERYAQAWSLCYARGHSFEEIATLIRCSPKRARTLVSNARKSLSEWMNLLAIVVDVHMTPSSPEAGQQVESWLDLRNHGYNDIHGLWVTLQIDKHRLGRQSTAVLRDNHTPVRGFTPWTRRQGRQTLLATWALGKKKKVFKTRVVENDWPSEIRERRSHSLICDLQDLCDGGSMNPNEPNESPQSHNTWLEDAVEGWRHQHRGCPDDAALVAYYQGDCPWQQQLALWWHVRRCALCRVDLAILHEVFAEEV